jgi:lipoate synthase
MNLKHVVITAVARDDLRDAGSNVKPVFTAQKRQALVHTAPKIINVAVRLAPQHSCIFCRTNES